MASYDPKDIVVTVNSQVVEGFADETCIRLSPQHPAWKIFEDVCLAEAKRISKIADRIKREEQLVHFRSWSKEETKNIEMLINNQESSIVDAYEELKHV